MKLRTLLLILTLSFALSLLSLPGIAQASTGGNKGHTATSNDVYTIRYFGDHGQLIKIWKGPTAEAQKLIKQERARLQALLLKQHAKQQQSIIQGQHGVSPYINRVSPCTLPNDFFDLFNEGLVCFANAGGINIMVYDVYEVTSGHNHGTYYGNTTYSCFSKNIGYESTDFYSPTVTITGITIL
jgi:hypothetical protein